MASYDKSKCIEIIWAISPKFVHTVSGLVLYVLAIKRCFLSKDDPLKCLNTIKWPIDAASAAVLSMLGHEVEVFHYFRCNCRNLQSRITLGVNSGHKYYIVVIGNILNTQVI